MILRCFLSACLVVLSACGDPPTSQRPLLVHCAASLSEAMAEAAREFSGISGNSGVDINSASSLLLRKQIEAEAPGDLFISASSTHMDLLQDAGRIVDGSRVELLRNRLALLVSVSSGIQELEDIASEDIRVAMASEGVPAGDYAREFLRAAEIWEEVSRSILSFPNEPAVFRAVARGLIPAAFVYASSLDAMDPDLNREIRLDPRLQPAIRYPAAVLESSKQPEQAKQLLRFLREREAQALFERHGFIPLIRS